MMVAIIAPCASIRKHAACHLLGSSLCTWSHHGPCAVVRLVPSIIVANRRHDHLQLSALVTAVKLAQADHQIDAKLVHSTPMQCDAQMADRHTALDNCQCLADLLS